jgi:hypothetical protein
MLESTRIQRRQSEIRERLSELVGKSEPSEDETREMQSLDGEYRQNETKLRAALIAEDEQREQAKGELESRDGKEWAELMAQYEVRQAVLALDEGKALSGATQEVVSELRNQGGFRGVPIPFAALEQRAGETVASGTPDPVSTRGLIDRLFPGTIIGRMGGRMINIPSGEVEYPVVTSNVTAGWAASETGAVTSPTAFTTVDRPLTPAHTLGVQMSLTRKTLKQTAGIEEAVRRDMRNAVRVKLDEAAFQGSGSSGEPAGVVSQASSYSIQETAVDAAASWSAFRSAVVRFMTDNAASAPDSVRLAMRPEVWDSLDGTLYDSGSGLSEWDKLTRAIPAGNIAMTNNALQAPSGSPAESKALLTTNAGGEAPMIMATWGAIDLIRDPYSNAASGGVLLTALVTADVTITRPEQLQVLTGLQ